MEMLCYINKTSHVYLVFIKGVPVRAIKTNNALRKTPSADTNPIFSVMSNAFKFDLISVLADCAGKFNLLLIQKQH